MEVPQTVQLNKQPTPPRFKKLLINKTQKVKKKRSLWKSESHTKWTESENNKIINYYQFLTFRGDPLTLKGRTTTAIQQQAARLKRGGLIQYRSPHRYSIKNETHPPIFISCNYCGHRWYYTGKYRNAKDIKKHITCSKCNKRHGASIIKEEYDTKIHISCGRCGCLWVDDEAKMVSECPNCHLFNVVTNTRTHKKLYPSKGIMKPVENKIPIDEQSPKQKIISGLVFPLKHTTELKDLGLQHIPVYEE